MSASNVSGFMNLQIPSGNPPVSVSGRGGDRDGDNEATGLSGTAHAKQGGGQLRNVVAQTLSQLGLGQPGQIAVTAPVATPNASGNNTSDSAPSNNGQNFDLTLQTFMHSLFQALNPGGVPTLNGSPRPEPLADNSDSRAKAQNPGGPSGYTTLVSQLQSFVQNLESNSNSAAGATSDLNAAFQSLTSTATNDGSAQPSLQSFLQDLLQNLQNAGNPPLSGLGNAVKTFA
ncbi:MAG: hypothetical protein HY847_15800 [Betaproteobacteria bacterium]|nr:hypothetical protein [Betaproteobacteria bacterium]